MKNNQTAASSETPKNKKLYHFPGEGKYQPMSIKAESYNEALEKWEKEKQLIN